MANALIALTIIAELLKLLKESLQAGKDISDEELQNAIDYRKSAVDEWEKLNSQEEESSAG